MKQIMNSYEYSVCPEHIDFQGRATIPSICGDIINAIGRNIRVEGYGVDVMQQAGWTWVLLRSAIEIDERPRLYDNFNVFVWPSKGSELTYNRCVKITNDEGQEIGRATTEWCVIDKETRRPISPGMIVDNADIAIPCKKAKRMTDFPIEESESKIIGYSDCDFNGHMNNTHYVEMFYNMLPKDLLSTGLPVRLDINYKHEGRSGAEVSCGIRKVKSDEFQFIAKSNDRTLCQASLTID